MKKISKLMAAVLSLAMLLTSIPGVYAAGTAVSATDGYFWLEAEDCADKHVSWNMNLTSTWPTDAVSGSGAKISQTAYPGEDGYYIDFNIDVEDAGSYDIWIYGGKIGNTWVSPGKIRIDGTDLAQQPVYHSRDDWGSSINIAWSKATANIAEGEQVLRYYINDVVTADNKTYQSVLDLICVVPSDYDWTPDGPAGTTTKPEAPVEYVEFTDGYLWVEAEESAETVGNFNTITDGAGKFTDGKAMLIKNDAGVVGTTKYSFKYFIEVPENGTYDININGTSNKETWNSPIEVDIDGTSYKPEYNADTITLWYSDWGCRWNTVEVNLTAGKHIVTVYTDEKAPASSTLFRMIFDAMCISPASWEWVPSIEDMPEAPALNEYLWLEETDASFMHGSYASFQTPGNNFYGGNAKYISVASAPTADGYHIDFEVNMLEGEYDIYFRSTFGNEWMSEPDFEVNGDVCETTDIVVEGYDVKANYHMGWRKATTSMSEGLNTIRWTLKESRTADTNWIGVFDAMVIVPKGVQFAPVKLNVAEGDTNDELAQTKLDYELAIAMQGIDLANVKSDLDLPTETESGKAITWITSNQSVITVDGTVIRPTDSDKVVNLTATCDGYTKVFSATVKMVKVYDVDAFAINGTIAAGNKISAIADIVYNLSGSKEVMLIVALYSKDAELLKIDIDKQDVTSAGKDLSVEITVPTDVDLTDAYAKAFLWNGIGDLKPIADAKNL